MVSKYPPAKITRESTAEHFKTVLQLYFRRFFDSVVLRSDWGWGDGGRYLYYLKFLRQGNGQDGRVGRPQAHHLSRAHRIYNIYRATTDGKDQNLAEKKLL